MVDQVIPFLSRANFVGRKIELSTLFKFFAQVTKGRPITYLIHGEPGLGKSSLLSEFYTKFSEENSQAILLSATCQEWQIRPYEMFEQIIIQLGDSLTRRSQELTDLPSPINAGCLLRVFPSLRSLDFLKNVDVVSEFYSPHFLLNRAALALKELFSLICERFPLVIFIDDIQWADEDSLALCQTLLQPPDAPGLYLLATLEISDKGNTKASLEQLAKWFPGHPRKLPLEPLPAEDSRAYTKHFLSSIMQPRINPSATETFDPTLSTCESVAKQTDGNPLFIQEIILHTLEQPTKIKPHELSLAEALLQRLGRLEPKAQTILEVLGISGTPLPQAIVAEVLKESLVDLAPFVDKLVQAQFIKKFERSREVYLALSHTVFKSAVTHQLSASARRQLHLQIAQVLESQGNPEPARLSLHYEAGSAFASRAKYAIKAAEVAELAYAFEQATAYYQVAIKNWSGDFAELRRLNVRLGDILANTARSPESAQAYLAAVSGAPSAEALELERRATEQFFRSGLVVEGLAVTKRVLENLNIPFPSSPKRALLTLLWNRIKIRLRGLRFQPCEEKETDPEALVKADICYSIGLSLSLIDHIFGACFSSRFVLSALAIGELRRVLYALGVESCYVAASGKEPSSYYKKISSRADELLKKKEAQLARVYFSIGKAFGSYMWGEWLRAKEQAEIAAAQAKELFGSTNFELTIARSVLVWVLYYLGDLRELSRIIPPWVQEAQIRGDLPQLSIMGLGLCNLVFVNQDGPESARQLIAEIMKKWTLETYLLQHYHALLAEVHIDLYTGKASHALQRVRADWPRLKQSGLLVLPSVKNVALYLRARAAVATSMDLASSEKKSLLKEAQKDIATLRRQKPKWTKLTAELLQVGIDQVNGNSKSAIKRLDTLIPAFDSLEMRLFAAAARRCMGTLLEGEEGKPYRLEAEKFMRKHKVQDPARLTAIITPGIKT